MTINFKYRPVRYYSLTYLVTFVLLAIGAYISYFDEQGLFMFFIVPGMMAPFMVSLAMILASKNVELKRDFADRLINLKRIDLRTLPFSILIMPLAVLVSIALSLPLGGSAAQFQPADGFSFSAGAIPAFIILLMASTFEELGWRGYAFNSLESRFGFLRASILFGVLWSFWHLPLIFLKDSYQYEIFQENIWYAVNFFVSIIPLGVIISWIWAKNNKSIIAAILFHFLTNMCQEALNMTQATKCIETLVLAAVAVAIIAYDKELFFKRSPRRNPEGAAAGL